MPLSATERLDDALDATLDLLTPFDAGRWLRLAVVAFFVGGLGGAPPAACRRAAATSSAVSAASGASSPTSGDAA
ncbi:DUF7544 domain-containing protein [Halosegnis marinus]|uniref:DUF7544 domain-containing protein n=1 Tax=Halosegnis marinus TaxID=3034023 RepID=UPI00362233A5